jgi:Cys-rich protein (TIGR04453 family)
LCFSQFGCKDPVREKCDQVCKTYMTCIDKSKKSTDFLYQSLRSDIELQCKQGCTMLQGEMIRCEEESKGCKAMGECLNDSGIFE